MIRPKAIGAALAVAASAIGTVGVAVGSAHASAVGTAHVAAGPAQTGESGRCTTGHVCVFADYDFGGAWEQFNMPSPKKDCQDYNLGPSVSGKVSSIDFPKTAGKYGAMFYSGKYYTPSLRLVTGLVNGNYKSHLAPNENDKIDAVSVCYESWLR